MAAELELKAVVPDPGALRARLVAAGAQPGFRGLMRDRRFDRNGELSARDEMLRVRSFQPDGGAGEVVIGWKGPIDRSPQGYKLRQEIELPLAAGAASPEGLLAALGYQVVHAIDREIEIFRLGQATLRLERYPRMDVLLEVEGEPAAIERATAATGIPRQALTADPLAEFVRRYELRTGQPALLVGEPGA
jgi:adenylate cyclase class IV